jgi:hypothetical protein
MKFNTSKTVCPSHSLLSDIKGRAADNITDTCGKIHSPDHNTEENTLSYMHFI